MSSVLDELRFTELNLNLTQFVDRFRSEFPVILITRTGIDPADDPLHCISAEEVYWISGIRRQKRIVAADVKNDENRRYFSIPLDYHRKFQLVEKIGQKEIRGAPVTMRTIVEGMNLTVGPTRFVFANSDNIRVNYEGCKSRSQKVGTLEVIERYKQKYLIGHTLYKNVMDMMPRSIPIYLDIEVDTATGFDGWNDATFKEWMRTVKELGNCIQSTPVKTCGEIIQFRELPECGTYDYIKPFNYMKTQDITKPEEPETTETFPQSIYETRQSISSEGGTRESYTYEAKPLPPIPSNIPDSLSVVDRHSGSPSFEVEDIYEEWRPIVAPTRRDKPTAPHSVDAEDIYEDFRPADRYEPRDVGADEIVPYAESRSNCVSQTSIIRRQTIRKVKSPMSQADTNSYSECTRETLRQGGLYTTRGSADDYEPVPYSKTGILSSGHLPGRDSRPNGDDTSTTSRQLTNQATTPVEVSLISQKLAGVYGEAIAVDTSLISKELAGVYGEPITVDTSLISKELAGVYGEPITVDTSLISEEYPGIYDEATECRLASPKERSAANGKAILDATSAGVGTGGRSPTTPTRLLQYKHISEIPASLDLSSLSVNELTHCLNLLGLSKYSDTFRENDVDGKLASEFSIETLVGSFNFSDFEAMKFTKFLKGWRPNV